MQTKLPFRPNFRRAQFSWIAISKLFAETIFTDLEFRVWGIVKFGELNFRGFIESANTAKITLLEILDVYCVLELAIKDKRGSCAEP